MFFNFNRRHYILRITVLTNGPGELWGWVRPVVDEFRRRGHSISLWILPCQFASGHEREAASCLGVDKLEGPSTPARIWHDIAYEKTDRVVQLGGDLIFGIKMAKSARVPLTVYNYRAWKKIPDARQFVAYQSQTGNIDGVQAIGDIVKDALDLDMNTLYSAGTKWRWSKIENSPRILILPGSRPLIRSAALEWAVELRKYLKAKIPEVRLRTLFSQFMPDTEFKDWQKAGLEPVHAGAGIAMREADYAITQPGTNNFELMHCGLPALVVAPEKFLKFVPVSGVLGILANLPLIGLKLRRVAAMRIIRRWNGFISLPNRTANEKIMTELYGDVTPEKAADAIYKDINNPENLEKTRKKLLAMSGEKGAASRLCNAVISNVGGG